jgi:transcriptional regulator with GAF, ATPase, and Fis domain
MKPRLVTVSGPAPGIIHSLTEMPLTIGRDSSNQLCLADPGLSRKHCLIQKSAQRYQIKDCDSRNGTFINGRPVNQAILCHGDTIRIGGSELIFLLHDEADENMTLSPNDGAPACQLTTIRLNGPELVPSPEAEIARMARDLSALIRISNIINSVRDLDLLQRELLQLIFEVVPAQQGAVVLLTDPQDTEGSVCNWSRGPGGKEPVSIRRELMQRALWEQSAVVATPSSSQGDQENVLCIPLLSVEKSLGVIYLISHQPETPFRDEHTHFLSMVARIAAVTLENRLIMKALSSENEQLKEQIHASTLLGESIQIAKVREFIGRVVQADSTVLICGESGTGKEVVARAIHHQSSRAARPFVAINCAAIPEALLESELFGHEKGAFTGAVASKRGKLEMAEDGTLFLDEIGELAPLLQAKLLRVLQQREFERLGGTRCLPFAARVLAATNKNLEQAIRSGQFRQDLYYRLNVVSVTVPPLRERREDVPLLALFFASRYAARSKRPFRGIAREARKLLVNYSWPGNVRELENAIEHAIVLGLTEEILPEDLPTVILEEQAAGFNGGRYHTAINQTKKELIVSALREAEGSYPDAARALGIHPKYLHRLVKNLRLRGVGAESPRPRE